MTGQDPLLGQTIHGGSILLQRLLGVGGMGRVYKGLDTRLNRSVAVKILLPEHLEQEEAHVYFEREARAASQLWHPNIIQIIDFGREGETLYIIMEFVPGASLADLIDDAFPIAPHRIVRIVSQILTGLEAAHAARIIHRDLKPENIMLQDLPGTPDFVKILDFGIAKALNSEQKAGPLTQQGLLVGTPQFMSPEQALGHDLDPRSDLYSVGAILYQMLTQYMPFDGDFVMHVLAKVITERPIEPSLRRPELPIHPQLEAIAMRSLRKRPEGRFQSAAKFREALLEVNSSPPNNSFQFTHTLSLKPLTDGTISALNAMHQETNDNSISSLNAFDNTYDLDPLPRRELVGHAVDSHALAVLAVEFRSPELIPRFRPILTQIIEDHGGVLTPHAHDDLTLAAFFGYPTPLAESAIFAVRVAHEILAECVQHASLMLGVGIAYGEVTVPADVLADANGAPIVRALDMASRAPTSSVYAHASLELAGGNLRLKPTHQFDAFVPLLDFGDRSARSLTIGIPLMGREEALQKLDQHLSALFEGQSIGLAIVGPRGIGKSRILNIMARGAERQNITVIEVEAERFPSIVPGRLLRRILMATLDTVSANRPVDALDALNLDPRERDILNQLFHFSPPLNGRRVWGDLLVYAFSKLLSRLASSQPLLVACDNFEAADELSFRVLERLATATRNNPVAIVVASMKGSSNTKRFLHHNTSITLGPIPAELISTFLNASYSGIGEEAIAKLTPLAAQHPHYLAWLMERALDNRSSTMTLDVSAGVDEVLNPLYFLDPNTERIAVASACLGFSFPLAVLIGGCPKAWQLREHLHHIGSQGMLNLRETHDGVWLGFRPSMLRLQVSEKSDTALRNEFHQRVAKHYERRRQSNSHPDHDYQWARHLQAAGFANAAFKMFKSALESTLSQLGPIPSYPLLQPLIDSAREAFEFNSPRFHQAIFTAVRFYLSQKQPANALRQLDTLEFDDDTPKPHFVECELLRARSLLALGRREKASTVLLAAQAKITDQAAGLRAEIHLEVAQFLFDEKIFDDALSEAQDAATFARAAQHLPLLSLHLHWRPLVLAGRIYAHQRDLESAVHKMREALHEAERRQLIEGRIGALRALAEIHSQASLYDQALNDLKRARTVAGHAGELSELAQLYLESGMLYIQMLDRDSAQVDLEKAIRLARRLADTVLLSKANLQLSALASLPAIF